ncbi:YjgB family protein [Brevibacillus borstelensis]|uniref:YjgB family protein n=1 Tax=Brevibacillus borstelensis TaxID=45462 RepID=UPI0030F6A1B7
MPSKHDEHWLDDLRNLPDITLTEQQKEKIMTAIRETDTPIGKRSSRHGQKSSYRLATLGRTAAAFSLLAATVWLGSQLITWNQSATLDPTVQPPNQKPAGSSHQEGVSQGTGGPNGTGGEIGSGEGAPIASSDKEADLNRTIKDVILSMKEKAVRGQSYDQKLTLETSMFDEVEQSWGKPDRTDYANGITYATYKNKGVILGYNKGMQIVDIRRVYGNWEIGNIGSKGSQPHYLSMADVTRVLGEPDRAILFAGQTIHIYNVTDKYQLKIVYQGEDNGKNELRAVRTDVFYPRGTVNLMQAVTTPELVQSIRDLAKEGRLYGVEYPVETSVFDTVEKDWGKADRLGGVNGVTYASYRTQGVVFGFNKGMQLVDIRSYDTRLQELSLSDVTSALGKPDVSADVSGQTIYTYKVNSKYELKFVFSGTANGQNAKTLLVDHVNIVYPKGAVNMMAQ